MMASEAPTQTGANAKNWVFTWYAHDIPATWEGETLDGRFTKMTDVMAGAEDIGYFFAGRETCPTTGAKHLQGFAHFEKKKRLTQLKKIWGGIHWEPAREGFEENWVYCTKEDKEPFTFGDLPTFANNGIRERNRWDDAYQMAKEGNFDEMPKDILLRCYNSCKAVHRDFQEKPGNLEHYNAEWIYGESGSGKSTLAREENPDSYPKECNKWWCGYQGQTTALVEDIDPECAQRLARYIKVWCDKFPFCAEVKGASSLIRPEKIVFTSQYTIEECFNERDAVAIRRRCKVRKIENFKEVETEVPISPQPGTAVTGVNVPRVDTPRPTRTDTVELDSDDETMDAARTAHAVCEAEDEALEQDWKRLKRDIRKGLVAIDLTQADDE